jgi:hypothetical protein
MVTEMGIDCLTSSLKYTCPNGDTKKFDTVLGVALTTNNPAALRTKYESVLKEALAAEGIVSDRKILSSFEIFEHTQGGLQVHERVYEGLKNELEKINIFYTSFNTQRINQIKTFGREGTRIKTLEEFYNEHLNNAFPHICAWKLNTYIRNTNANVYCDNFFSYTTEAWEEIRDYPNMFVLTRGDQSNYLISLADIFVKYLDGKTKETKRSFYWPHIEKTLGLKKDEQKLYIHTICNKDLPKITPLAKAGVKLGRNMKHPIYFFMMPKGGTLDFNLILSKAPRLLNEVYEAGGCICAFHQRNHNGYIQDDDVFIYADNAGKVDAETIASLGNKLEIRDIKHYTSKIQRK